MGALKLVNEIDEDTEQLLEVIKEIKLQRQLTLENPNGGNVTALVAWFDHLLHHIEKKLSS